MDPLKSPKFGDLVYFYLLYKLNMEEEARIIYTGKVVREIVKSKDNYAKKALLKLHSQLERNVQGRVSMKFNEGIDNALFVARIKNLCERMGIKLVNITIIITI